MQGKKLVKEKWNIILPSPQHPRRSLQPGVTQKVAVLLLSVLVVMLGKRGLVPVKIDNLIAHTMAV
jgi:hypothetical protein